MNFQPRKLVQAIAPALLVLSLGACSTMAPRPLALDDARIAVDNARATPNVATYAGVELNEAVNTYQRAEAVYGKEGDTADVRNLSYLAKQRVAIARESANLRQAEQAVTTATAERERVRLAARAAETDVAIRNAQLAELRADVARRAARDAEIQASAAQQQAAASQQQAAISQQNALSAQDQARLAEMRTQQLEAELRELSATKSDRGLVVTMNDVLFDSGSATLRPGGVRLVSRLGDFLREYPERTIAIEGFTDSVGDDVYNQALSERRAATVRLALADAGVDSARIISRGYGEAFPVASNDTAEGRQRNRRVEVVIGNGREVTPRIATYSSPR